MTLTFATPAVAGCYSAPFPAGPWKTETAAAQSIEQHVGKWGGYSLVDRTGRPFAACAGIGASRLDDSGQSLYRVFDCNFNNATRSFSAVEYTVVLPARWRSGISLQSPQANLAWGGWYLVAGRCY